MTEGPSCKKDTHDMDIGLFDVTARPFVTCGTLTFSVLMNKFKLMIANIGGEFSDHQVLEQDSGPDTQSSHNNAQ